MNKIGTKQNISLEDQSLDLSALLDELFRNKWLITLIAIITLSIGGLYAHLQMPQYQSDILLQVDSGRSNLHQGGLMEQLALGGSSANEALTQTALIQSRFILIPIIQALHLDIQVKPKPLSIWNYLVHPQENNAHALEIELFKVPRESLNKKYYVSINKPGFVSLFNAKNKLILEGKEGLLLSNKEGTIKLKVKAIHGPLGAQFTLIKRSKSKVMASLLKQLTIQETGVKGRQASTGILNITLKGKNPNQIVSILDKIALTAQSKDVKKKAQEASQTLAFLEQQLPITKEQLQQAEYNLNQYRAQSGKIDLELQTQALISRFTDVDKEISKLRVEQVNLQNLYTSQHPMLIALNKQLNSLKVQRSELEQTLKKSPDSDQLAVNLLREVTVKKELYLILLSKIQELQVVKAGTISSLRILSMAKIPEEPLPSKTLLIYFISLILGFILSILIIFIHRMLASKIEDPHWSEEHFNLPNVAIIPFSKEQKIQDEPILLAYTHPKNLSIESLRSLRTSLQVSLAGAKNNIVSILGMSPGVGKSFISANIAYLFASIGKKVLLIDADLRKGTAHHYLNIPPSPGLADLLKGTLNLDEVVVKTAYENLSCIPRGAYPENPSELLMTGQFKTLLQTLSECYDLVVIDTSPILLVTDAVIVSAIAGINYLVLGAGVHQPKEVEVALKRLLSSGTSLHGSVFNYTRPQLKKMLTSKYAYGNYGYAYYYDDEGSKSKK